MIKFFPKIVLTQQKKQLCKSEWMQSMLTWIPRLLLLQNLQSVKLTLLKTCVSLWLTSVRKMYLKQMRKLKLTIVKFSQNCFQEVFITFQVVKWVLSMRIVRT